MTKEPRGLGHIIGADRQKVARVASVLSAIAFSGLATAATAQSNTGGSTTIPEVFSTAPQGGSASVTVRGIARTVSSDVTIDFRGWGDFISSTENVEVFLDGVSVGILGNGPAASDCGFFNESITVPRSDIAPLITDGELNIRYQATDDVDAFCGDTPEGSGDRGFTISGTISIPEANERLGNDVISFLGNRARSLVQNQPDVARFVDGRAGGNVSIDASQGNTAMSLSNFGSGPVWGSLSYSSTETDTGDQDYVFGAFGAHVSVGQNAVIGAMVQVDRAEDSLDNGDEVSGTGWLVGPYFATQISQQQVFIDGRVLAGQTDNEIKDENDIKGDFDGRRVLANLGVSGRLEYDRFALLPSLDANYVRDEQDKFTDSAGAQVDDQSVTYRDITTSLNFEVPVANFLLTGGVAAIAADSDEDSIFEVSSSSDETVRGRVDLGYRYDGGSGLQSNAAIFFDGIGDDDAETLGATFSIVYSF